MNAIYRSLIILLPLIVLITYGTILITDQDDALVYFEPKEFPQFDLQDLEDREIDLAAFNGISLLNVWASWCITCLVEHPFLTQLSKNEITVIGLNYKDSQLKAQQWLGKRIQAIQGPRRAVQCDGDLTIQHFVLGAVQVRKVAHTRTQDKGGVWFDTMRME